VTLAGGTVRTTSTTAISAQGGVAVTGDLTIDVAAGTILTLPAITGTGNITKTGDGTLCFSEASPDFSGAIHVTDGAIGVSGEGAAGSGQLTFEAGAQLKVFATADLLAAGGDLIVSQPNLASGSADPSIVVVAPGGLTELMDSVDYVCSAGSGTIVFTFPMRASGYGAWFDFTFTRKDLPGRQTASRNIRNDGYAGASAYLLFDGDWRGTDGYNTANGRLLMKTTPCRDMTGAFAWPSNWTVAVAAHLPATENACLLAIGSTSRDHGSRNYLALARGTSSGEVRLVNGTGYTAAQSLATMSVPQTGASDLHLFILSYNGTTCDVYHASSEGGNVERIGTCTLESYVPGGGLQIGSIHGGIGGTGLLRVNELPQADADACEVRSIRIFSTVLNAPCRQALYEELVRTRGMKIVIR
jgi:autotransporter-associated beta strand protein